MGRRALAQLLALEFVEDERVPLEDDLLERLAGGGEVLGAAETRIDDGTADAQAVGSVEAAAAAVVEVARVDVRVLRNPAGRAAALRVPVQADRGGRVDAQSPCGRGARRRG